MVGRGLLGARLFRAQLWCPTGSGGTREAGGSIAKSVVALYQFCSHQIWRGLREARSSTSQESAGPLCPRIRSANWEVSEAKADLWPRFCSFLQGLARSGERARILGRLLGMHRALDGWMLALVLASRAQGLLRHGPRYFIFAFLCMTCGLENVRLVYQNGLESDLPASLLRTLAVGRRY